MVKQIKEYATRDIANIVDIAEPTVRKYAQSLEKAGYGFTRNENGYRIFTDRDILTFNEMKNLSKRHGLPVKKIVDMIIMDVNQEQEGVIRHVAEVDTPLKTQERQEETTDIAQYDGRFNQLIEKLDKLDKLDDMEKRLNEQMEFNKLLMKRLDEQQQYIEGRLADRDERLMESLRQLQEQKQAILEVASARKKWWQRLFA